MERFSSAMMFRGFFLAAVLSTLVHAETVTLRPVADTTLLESAPDFNMGSEWHVAAGTTGSMAETARNRALIRFDLDSIPAGAEIQSVTLRLDVVWVPGRDGGGGPASSIFALHKILRPWAEGSKMGFRGEFATMGEATWNHAIAPGISASGGARWSAPGGVAPIDFVAASSATTAVSGIDTYLLGPAPGLLEDVQSWLRDSTANFGWILISQSETRGKTARRFGSRENPDHPPALEIEFNPPEQLRIENVQRIGTNIQFHFTAEPLHPYAVQFRDAIAGGAWQIFTNIPPQTNETTVTIAAPVSSQQRFFRLAK